MTLHFNIAMQDGHALGQTDAQPGQGADAAENAVALSLVVPSSDAAQRLDRALLLRFASACPSLRFVFVDDADASEASGVVADLRVANPGQVDIVKLAQSAGRAEAARRGLLQAARTGAAYIGYWDPELAIPLANIYDLVEIANRYEEIEVVCGARLPMSGYRFNGTSRTGDRGRPGNRMTGTRLPLQDGPFGAGLFRNSADLQACLDTPFESDLLFDIELLARLSARVSDLFVAFCEFPLSGWQHPDGCPPAGRVTITSGLRMPWLVTETDREAIPSRLPQDSVTAPRPWGRPAPATRCRPVGLIPPFLRLEHLTSAPPRLA